MKIFVVFLLIGVLVGNLKAQYSWSSQYFEDGPSFNDVYFYDRLTGWAAGTWLMRTVDGGITWVDNTPYGYAGYEAICFINAQKGWAVNYTGRILYSDDGGITWADQNSGTTSWLRDITFINETVGWVAGYDSILLYTDNGGENWEERSKDIHHRLESIFFIDEQHGWLVGESYISKTSNAGNSWTSFLVDESNYFGNLFFVDTLTGWCGGGHQTIMKTIDGGETWEEQNEDEEAVLSYIGEIFFVDKDTGWAAADDGYLYYTENGGEIWDKQYTGFDEDFDGVFFLNKSTGWVVGSNNRIIFTGESVSGNDFQEISADLITSYPNPCTEFIKIKYKGKEDYLLIEIMDMQSRIVLQDEIFSRSELDFNIVNLLPGYYLIRIKDSNSTYIEGFIKQ